jgi:hypothetical protein
MGRAYVLATTDRGHVLATAASARSPLRAMSPAERYIRDMASFFGASARGTWILAPALALCACTGIEAQPGPATDASAEAMVPGDASSPPTDGGDTDAAPGLPEGAAGNDATPGGEAVIVNSGSTNAGGFRIEVAPDDHVTWHLDPTRSLGGPLACATADGSVVLTAATGTMAVSKLFADLAAAGSLASVHFEQCAKSVSFGTTTSLAYGGVTVPDTECGSATDTRAAALSQDVTNVESAVTAACK